MLGASNLFDVGTVLAVPSLCLPWIVPFLSHLKTALICCRVLHACPLHTIHVAIHPPMRTPIGITHCTLTSIKPIKCCRVLCAYPLHTVRVAIHPTCTVQPPHMHSLCCHSPHMHSLFTPHAQSMLPFTPHAQSMCITLGITQHTFTKDSRAAGFGSPPSLCIVIAIRHFTLSLVMTSSWTSQSTRQIAPPSCAAKLRQ